MYLIRTLGTKERTREKILIRAEIKKHKIVKINKGISCPFDED